tara:strand:- start:1260 stop:1556 length:297 start_codon:yes stop_codon:yes gene_type:complete
MSELFKALQNFEPQKRKTSWHVTIDGKKLEVDESKHREILTHGTDAFMLQGDEIVRKPIKRGKIVYGELIQGEIGYNFHHNDPYWPNEIVKGGHTWTK